MEKYTISTPNFAEAIKVFEQKIKEGWQLPVMTVREYPMFDGISYHIFLSKTEEQPVQVEKATRKPRTPRNKEEEVVVEEAAE